MNIILVSIASLATAQPMSLTEQSSLLLSCNLFSCAGSILGKSSSSSSQLSVNSFLLQELWRPVLTLGHLRRSSPALRTFSTVLDKETAWLVLCQGNNIITEDKVETRPEVANPNCPGGDLAGCMALCPQDDSSKFQKCVKECISACS